MIDNRDIGFKGNPFRDIDDDRSAYEVQVFFNPFFILTALPEAEGIGVNRILFIEELFDHRLEKPVFPNPGQELPQWPFGLAEQEEALIIKAIEPVFVKGPRLRFS